MDMTLIAAPLQAALAAKGYEKLTPVQEAVLAPELQGRDLLVSAQTGSGKTVAFGLAIAPEILSGMDKFLPADKPMALVIAPTRELALQVQRELVWLYKDAVVASCVGGMDYRTERRSLERGAHIVVGTPGRLRDHVERGSLDLSELCAVVLDEADEMLDMGFADDLEFLLGSAPDEKRVLMFSATVPKEIATLAATYQRDARRVEVKSSASQHADIEYRAISVANRDREPAIFNLLRWYDARVAIIFAKTRANVNHLHARMVNRGFPVVALSGELSQTERLHALQALRDGRARVCIATDVAARGIDLPGLDLVIHADLPSNSETMLHRSGRTGRAGNKGVSVLVVPQSEFRKANRILQGAKVVAEWGKAPGADAVQQREDERLVNDPALTETIGEEAAIATSVLEAHGPEAVAAAFVRLWRAGRSAPEDLVDDLPPPVALPPRERGEFGESVWYKLSVGHTGRAEARWLLPKICDAGGIAKDGIGAIRVQQDFTFVQIAAPLAERFREMTEIEPGLVMERIAEAPEFGPTGRPAGGPRGERGDRGDRGDRGAPRRDRGDRPERGDRGGDRDGGKSFGGKPRFHPADNNEDRKPFGRRDGEERAPRADRGDRFGGERPERGDRERTERHRTERTPRPAGGGDRFGGDKGGFKSAGFRSHGGGAEGKPARAGGFKSHKSEGASDRPFGGKRDGDRDGGKSWGSKSAAGAPRGDRDGGKSFGAKKPFDKFDKKPSAPRGDARDTSKRFAPPRKK